MERQILPGIFERSMSLDRPGRNNADRAMSLWENMARSLDEIAANTRGLFPGVAQPVKVRDAPAARGGKTLEERGKYAGKAKNGGKKTDSVRRTLAARGHPAGPGASEARPAANKARQVVPTFTRHAVAGEIPATPAPSQTIFTGAVKTPGTKSARAESAAPAATRPKTQSQQNMERAKAEAAGKAQAKTIADTLKDHLKDWDGSLAGGKSNGDLHDTVGLAAGGPVYAAMKEISDAIGSGGDDASSLLGALRKTAADKTGISAVVARAESVREGARDKIMSWAGTHAERTNDEKKQSGRDSQGRFIRSGVDGQAKEQIEVSAQTLDLAQHEAKEDGKRHKELLRAVRSIDGGGGLFDGFPGFGRGRGRAAGPRGKAPGGGRFSRIGSALGGALRAGGGILATGAGMLGAGSLFGKAGSLLGIGTEAAPAVLTEKAAAHGATAIASKGSTAAATQAGEHAAAKTASTAAVQVGERAAVKTAAGVAAGAGVAGMAGMETAGAAGAAGKGGGLLAKAGSLGAKGAATAAKAIPVLGQAVAVGMAAMDGIDGWSDSQMHQQAFDLADGQEASTGQKASAAAANVLDMGGLFTGAAGLLGFDVQTADIAKGIYGLGDKVGGAVSGAWSGLTDFFSSKKKAQTVQERANPAQEARNEDKATATASPLATISSLFSSALDAAKSFMGIDDAEEDLGRDAVITPDDKNNSVFEDLAEAVTDLGDTIKSEIKKREAEDSLMPAVGGALSGISSWLGGKIASFTGGGASVPASAVAKDSHKARYSYDPNAKIGESIAKFESGNQGVHAIGYDRTGGTSYGKFQLSSTSAQGGEGSMQGYLRHMQSQGGEKAAIAERIMAAGPLNTGSKNGAAVSQYAKEAAANPQLMEDSQREYMLKANYAPAMAALSKTNGDLTKRIEGSKALQEAMFSTAVQHGSGAVGKGAGAWSIWNKAYKEGMSDEDLIRAVYAERGTRFGSSTAQVRGSVQNRLGRESDLIVGMSRSEKGAQDIAAAVQSSPADKAVQTASSAVIQSSTQDAIDRGVRYGFGSKNSQRGAIDCSGWVAEMNRNLMDSVNAAMGKEVYGKEAKKVLAKGAEGGAAGIIKAVSTATGEQLTNADLTPDKVREGMMIGMDTGDRGWDRGRYKGIDHIVQTFRDPETGRMMVSESTSGGKRQGKKDGVRITPYDDWHAEQDKKGVKLYGADINKLADASKLAPDKPSTALAENVDKKAEAPGQAAADASASLAASSSTTQAVAAMPPTSTATEAPGAQASQVAASTAVSTAQAAPAAALPRQMSAESVGEIAPPQNTSSNNMQTGGIEKLLKEILVAIRSGQNKSNAPPGRDAPPHISMEFDDPALISLAHDRA